MNEIYKNEKRAVRPLTSNAISGNVLSQYELYEYGLKSGFSKDDLEEIVGLLYDDMANSKFKIDKLKLYEFRRYKSLFIDFESDLTVVIGENGAGKTSIVDSIARVISWFSSRIIKLNNNGLHILDVDINEKAKDYAQIVGLFSLNKKSNLELSLVRNVAGWYGDVSSDLQDSTRLGEIYRFLVSDRKKDIQLPVFVYYTVERTFSNPVRNRGDVELKAFFSSRFNAYKDFSGASAKTEIFLMHYVELHNLADYSDDYKEKLKLVEAAIESAVPYIQELGIDRSSGRTEVKLNNFGSRISFSQLSQGQKTLAALVGDLALRMIALNPIMDNPLHAQGIVLIDEVELHLHPKWQQRILLSLVRTFKNVQFIVTTHSPHVLSTVDKRSIRILRAGCNGEAHVEKSDFQTKGVMSSDVLERLMGTHAVPLIEESEWITNYQRLIEEGIWENDSEGPELKGKLLNHFGINHPVIKDIEAQIRLKELKSRVRNKQE